MNDPGLDEPIRNNAKKIEKGEEEGGNHDCDQSFLDPSRWWFASTAFPLLAGTFGPIASAFNICALAEHWRVRIDPGQVEEHATDIPDPGWLLAVNSISLIFAVIANMALLFNMARRLSFNIAQPITIIGWYVASFLLIGLVGAATTGLKLPGGEQRALNQAFYYAIIAAALYFIIATLMMINVWGAYSDHYPKEFELTTSQRTLMLQTIAYMVYLLGGAGVFCRVEQWAYLDAVYWADFTLLTIGIGDYSPATHLGRGLLFPYAVGGIVILGLVIGSIRSLVLERGKEKLGVRMVEKKREQVVKSLEKSDGKTKITPLSKSQNINGAGKSERERREDEFHLMRKIQDYAATQRKWLSLSLSGGAWFFLWFIGALVFFKSEKNQDWTYFGSLYFAYTTLLTIGYGDFAPESNSGKPFFVFWSLLAVPTLTILISNMGDTVVKLISDLTLRLGEFTVLPGQSRARDRVKAIANKGSSGRFPFDEPPGVLGSDRDQDNERDIQSSNGIKHISQRLASEFEDAELGEQREAQARGDDIGSEVHHYHYLLVKEIRQVMNDVGQSPPKKYSYDDWAWFLKLMGEDEGNASTHRAAKAQVAGNEGEHTTGIDYDQPDAKGSNSDSSRSRVVDDSHREEEQGNVDEKGKWSWLGARSPLMGDSDEADWVLERLSATLEKELKELRDAERKGGHRQPELEERAMGAIKRDGEKE